MNNPKDTRMVQTRDGVAHIPRSQPGVPMKDYFQNIEFPEDLERSVVYATPSGPVVMEADLIPWTQAHDEKVQKYAQTIKEQIEDKGYYAQSLDNFANRLSDETVYPKKEMKAAIASQFEELYGNNPFDHLQNIRAEKGLPVREQQAGPQPQQEQEL